jgi:hypothetical protein
VSSRSDGRLTGRADQDAAEQTRGSLQAIALEALDQLRARGGSPLLFPNALDGHLDFRNFNRRHWKPVQKQSGSSRFATSTTCATFALRAGLPVVTLSRFTGTSIAMIDLHYGHLAVDSYQHTVSLLDALGLERAWTLVGRRLADRQGRTATRFPGLVEGASRVGGGRSVDATARSRRYRG